MSISTLSSAFAFGPQSVSMLELLECNGHKLRIEIKSDAYKEQSHALVSVLEKDVVRWHAIHTIMPGNMKTPSGLIYGSEAQRTRVKGQQVPESIMKQFNADRTELISIAILLLD